MRKQALLMVICGLFFALAVHTAFGDSVTMDEQNHLARGLALLKSGDPHLSLEHPPLINVLAALPVAALFPKIALPFDHPSWYESTETDGWYEFARLLLWEYNPEQAQEMVVFGRLPIIWLTMMLGLVAYQFGRKLWHSRAGLIACLLIFADPNIMAHGHYITTDLGGTATLFFALFALWSLWQTPKWSWRRWGVAVIALGCAFASKLSMLTFVPIFAILPLFYRPNPLSPPPVLRNLWRYFSAGAASLIVVWLIFACEWGVFRFASADLLWLNQYHGPMPTFWAGIERIATTTEVGRQAYLLGQYSDAGFPLYFPIAFLVKTPLPALWLFGIAILWLISQRATKNNAYFLLLPIFFYFGTATRSGLNIGYRHLLPILPLLYLVCAGFVPTRWRENGTLTWRSFNTIFVVIGMVATQLWTHPHYLAYFNWIAGGSADGWHILGDSNLDWGQDLLRLRAWMDENEVEELNLSYFGSADPSRYLRYQPLPGEPRHRDLWWAVPFDRTSPQRGLYVISTHNLLEMPLRVEEKHVYAYFRQHPPDEQITPSLWLWRVP